MYRLTIIWFPLNMLTLIVSTPICLKLSEPCLLQSHWNSSSTSQSNTLELDDVLCDWQLFPHIQTSLPEFGTEDGEHALIPRSLSHNWIPKCPPHILVNVGEPSNLSTNFRVGVLRSRTRRCNSFCKLV